jgi:hypothetical protein
MQTHEKFLAAVIVAALLAGLSAPHWWPAAAATARPRVAPVPTADTELAPVTMRTPPLPPFDPSLFAVHVETTHYAIASNATPAQTQQVAEAIEALHAAYAGFFAGRLPPRSAEAAKYQVALYRDRADFRAHNATRAWSHGYYRTPVCTSYFDAGAAQPVQWLLHEATHQLDVEWAGFTRTPWVEEAIASYFGTSRIDGGAMRLGDLDPGTYPLRWLRTLPLSGDRQRDLAMWRIVSLRELIESDGPTVPSDVNRYYLGYWSLAHYLLHGEDGRHAEAFRTMVANGGSLADFERLVGPVEQVEAGWYAYLLAQREALRAVGDEEGDRGSR